MKKSFTLLELILAIIIFSFVYLVMTDILSKLKNNEELLKKFYKYNSFDEKIIKTLYLDLINATSIKVIKKNKNFSILYLRTTNSLYNLSYPYVVWYVYKHLIRVESVDKILLPLKKPGYLYDFKKVKIFRVFKHNDKYFIFLRTNKDYYFEIVKE